MLKRPESPPGQPDEAADLSPSRKPTLRKREPRSSALSTKLYSTFYSQSEDGKSINSTKMQSSI